MTKTIKIVLIAGGAILLVVLGFYFMPSSSSTDSGLVKSVSPSGISSADSSNATAFLSTLLSLNKIKVDTSIFTSPVFTKLQDNTVPILNDGVVGRSNPFSEIDGTTPVDNGMSFPQINNVVDTKSTTPAK
jgi:hypothetical protein